MNIRYVTISRYSWEYGSAVREGTLGLDDAFHIPHTPPLHLKKVKIYKHAKYVELTGHKANRQRIQPLHQPLLFQ